MIKSFAVCLFFIGLVAAVPIREKHKDRGFTARRVVLKDNYIGFKELSHDINVGSNYFNNEYGFFRAEKSGMHFFAFNLISSDVFFRVSLRVNGKPQVWAFAQSGYKQAGNSVTLYLNEGDIVYLYLEEGSTYEQDGELSYRGFGTFTGHRLSFDETKPIVPRSAARPTASPAEKNTFDHYGQAIPQAWKHKA